MRERVIYMGYTQEHGDGRERAGQEENNIIEGRNAVIEAFRAGRTVDKLFILDGCKDGPILTIKREAAKHGYTRKWHSLGKN